MDGWKDWPVASDYDLVEAFYNPRNLPTRIQSVFIGKHFVAIVNANDGDSLEEITDQIWWKS